jgi:hypothetical protein
MKTTVTVTTPSGVNPFSHNTTRTKRNMVREFRQLLKALIAGAIGNRLYVRPTLLVGTAPAQAVVTCASVAGADTVTINGQALTATQHYATNTITCTQSGIDVDDTVTFNFGGSDVIFTAKATEDTSAGQFAQITSDDAVATSLAACINANATCAAVLLASVASNVVTVRSLTTGTGPNAWTLVSSDAQLAIGAGTFTNGAAIGNNEFDFVRSDTLDAASLAYAINNSTTNIVSKHVAAGTRKATITLSSTAAGSTCTIDGVKLTAVANAGTVVSPVEFYMGGTDTEDAAALVACINAHPHLRERVFASNSSGVVTIREIPPEGGNAIPVSASGMTASGSLTEASAACFIVSQVKGHAGNSITIASSSGSTLAIGGSVSRLAGGSHTSYTF